MMQTRVWYRRRVAHIGCLATLTLVAGGLSGCLLDTQSVNHAPTVAITAPTSIKRGTPATFTAQVHDADEDIGGLVIEWHLRVSDKLGCPQTLADATIEHTVDRGYLRVKFDVSVDYVGPLCVWV